MVLEALMVPEPVKIVVQLPEVNATAGLLPNAAVLSAKPLKTSILVVTGISAEGENTICCAVLLVNAELLVLLSKALVA